MAITTILFRFINFGLLLVLFGYLYRKYGRSLLIKQMQKKQDEVDTLEKQNGRLLEAHQEVEQERTARQAEGQILAQKLEQWAASVREVTKKFEQEKSERVARLLKKSKKQSSFLAQQKVMAEIKDRAITHAVQTLTDQYASGQRGSPAMSALIMKISKENS